MLRCIEWCLAIGGVDISMRMRGGGFRDSLTGTRLVRKSGHRLLQSRGFFRSAAQSSIALSGSPAGGPVKSAAGFRGLGQPACLQLAPAGGMERIWVVKVPASVVCRILKNASALLLDRGSCVPRFQRPHQCCLPPQGRTLLRAKG